MSCSGVFLHNSVLVSPPPQSSYSTCKRVPVGREPPQLSIVVLSGAQQLLPYLFMRSSHLVPGWHANAAHIRYMLLLFA
uniref:Uncharacterized protein n=1 Tax=Steinernema glaseri TaxID=37863 RepID=A0A1I8AMN0_9BILA